MTSLNKISLLMPLLGSLVSLSACSTTMTTMTEARAYEPGEVQVAVDYQANLHTTLATKAYKGAKSANEQFGTESDEPISEEAYRDWLDLALAAALFRPATSPELVARVGVTDKVLGGIDLGFRTNFNILKGDVKLQLWESADTRQALSVMAGYAHHRDVGNSLLSYVTLTDFSRKDFDFQLMWGLNFEDIVKLNVAPHMILSKISAEQKIPQQIYDRLPDSIKQYDPNQLFRDEWLGYYGMNGVVMLGYKYVFLVVDTGLFWTHFKPEVLGEQRNFSGMALSLAGGISVNYDF